MSLFENLKTTVTQALAVTMVDESQRVPRSAEDGSPGPPPVLPAVGDVVGGLYRLVRVLGEGMFGKVYVAQRIDVPEHQVALKLLPRSLYVGRNVERELVMLATVGHPHVVSLKDHGTNDDYIWLTMPVYEGQTLAERLERGALGLREAHDIFLPIARGLEALHHAGLRHQDIKPENIYLAVFAGRVHPILLDLGVAAEVDATFCAGTALFASPEQLLSFTGVPGAVPLSEKMDTYCLAATLLVSLLGPKLFPGEGAKSRDEIADAHDTRASHPIPDEALPQLVGHPRELIQHAFARWMSLDPVERPSMAELSEQLDVLLEPEREAAREEEQRLERQKTALWRFRLAAGAMLVVGLGVVGFGYSKRETLRLAGELEKARAHSAESFDKLDTCVASHKIARSEAAACKRARDEDKADFKSQLDGIARSGTGAEAEHARQLQGIQASYQSKLKVCEDEGTAAQKAAQGEHERLEKEKAGLLAERDELKTLAEKRAGEVQALTSERDVCVTERANAIEARDACKNAGDPCATPSPPRPVPTGAPGPPAPGTGVPGPPPAPAPTAPAPAQTGAPAPLP